MPNKLRVGEKFRLNCGSTATVLNADYFSCIRIQTSSGFVTNVNSAHLLSGTVKDKLFPAMFGVAFIGEGKYTTYDRSYASWKSMLHRCYTKTNDFSAYKGCSVHTTWFNFQVYAAWYTLNYTEGHYLDKDLKVPGNKVYGPDTCIFVPRVLNNIFRTNNNKVSDLPLGVRFSSPEQYYIVTDPCSKKVFVFNINNVCSLNNAITCYWNLKYNSVSKLAKEYPEFADILFTFFEYWFNKNYPQ